MSFIKAASSIRLPKQVTIFNFSATISILSVRRVGGLGLADALPELSQVAWPIFLFGLRLVSRLFSSDMTSSRLSAKCARTRLSKGSGSLTDGVTARGLGGHAPTVRPWPSCAKIRITLVTTRSSMSLAGKTSSRRSLVSRYSLTLTQNSLPVIDLFELASSP